MELIKWSNLYSVKNSVIDNQHKKLIKIMNELFKLIAGNKDKQKMEKIIDRLIEYTVYHFKTEEDLLIKHNYPNTEKHKEEHQGFVNQVHQFQADCLSEKKPIRLEVFSFLKKWILNHIIGFDKQYMRYFEDNAIKDYFD